MSNSNTDSKVALITGAGKRVGATIARHCHQQGMRIVIHYRNSATEAKALAEELNQQRPDTAICFQAELQNTEILSDLIKKIIAHWGRLDILINNAASFYRTEVGEITEENWNILLDSNLKAPLFLSQAAAPYLKEQKGCIINLVDIQAKRPMRKHTVYCVAKAGLVMLTKCLAKELGPSIRVNAIAPGIVLWGDEGVEVNPAVREKIIARIALKRAGTPTDVAETAIFLIQNNYITGQIITVDGGLSLDY